MNKYSLIVTWSDEDKGYVATCPELPGLSAFGETEEEAIAEAKVARALFVQDIIESGEALPEPLTLQQYSGQTRLRMPKLLHRQAAVMAEQDGVSLNTYITDAVRTRVTSEQFGGRVLSEIRAAVASVFRVPTDSQYTKSTRQILETVETFNVPVLTGGTRRRDS